MNQNQIRPKYKQTRTKIQSPSTNFQIFLISIINTEVFSKTCEQVFKLKMFHLASNILYVQLLPWDLRNQTTLYASESRPSVEIFGAMPGWTNGGVVQLLVIQTTKRKALFQVSSSSASSNVVNKDDKLRTFSLHKSNTCCKIFWQFVRCIASKLPIHTKKSSFHSFTAKCIYAH